MNLNLLPIGSVVKLDTAEKPLMIFGILQRVKHNDVIETFDYIGVPYPMGFLDYRLTMGFNNEQISEVLFEGFKSGDEWDNYLKAMTAAQIIETEKEWKILWLLYDIGRLN